ncbi:MAG: hypothetical protein FVQ79_00165 [Planctomycetes bacterium]|nr:hypothetical protein [Planctomycetota bacterium]
MSFPRNFESYPDEFFALYLKASKDVITLVFPSKGKAVNTRQRLYSFRAALRRVHHSFVPVADRVEIALSDTHLICRPSNFEVKDVFAQAGVKTEDFLKAQEDIDHQEVAFEHLGYFLEEKEDET